MATIQWQAAVDWFVKCWNDIPPVGFWTGFGIILAVVGILWPKKDHKQRKLIEAIARKLEINPNDAKQLGREQGIPLEALVAILRTMGEDAGHDPAYVKELLEKKAKEYVNLKARLEHLSSNDPKVGKLRERARKALASGALEKAEAFLLQAMDRDLEAIKEQEGNLRQRRLSAAESCAAAADTLMLRPNPASYRQAAGHYAQASEIALAADKRVAFRYQAQQAEALIDLGDEFGDNTALTEAITILENVVAAIDRQADPLTWAAVQNDLGNALFCFGKREHVAERLKEAVTAYEEALKERTRELVPLDWAMTQNNLGNALSSLGELANDPEQLKEAVTAYEEALKEYTRERVPLKWAITQNNLGTVLSSLGELANDPERLKEAVTAFQEALKERIRERVPLDWAMTQYNLGNALSSLGELANDPKRLKEAVTAYEEALKERTRERVPPYWAMTQHNLGNAYWLLSKKENTVPNLRRAEACFAAVLEGFLEEETPRYHEMAARALSAVREELAGR